MKLLRFLLGLTLVAGSALAAKAPYPAEPTFDQLRQNALRTFLGSNHFDSSDHAPISDFYIESSSTGKCRPLADLRTYAERALTARNFQDAGADVRYPRQTIAASRFKEAAGAGKPAAFDIVMLVLDVRKQGPFDCSFRVGAYARREGDAHPQSPRQAAALGSDLNGVFADVRKAVSGTQTSEQLSPATLAARSSWLVAATPTASRYAALVQIVQSDLRDAAQRSGACCANLRFAVIRNDAPPVAGSIVLVRNTCEAFANQFDVPTILCTEDQLSDLEAKYRAFSSSPESAFTADAMMQRYGGLGPPDGASLPAGPIDQSALAYLRMVMLFIGAHEVGHLQPVFFDLPSADTAQGRLDPVKLAISDMCRQFDGMRQDGFHLDVYDSPMKPGADANAIWRRFETAAPLENGASTAKFENERHADRVGIELLLAFLDRQHDLSPGDYPEQRSSLTESIYVYALTSWHQQLYDFERSACHDTAFAHLTTCFLFGSNGYVAAQPLFDHFHRNILNRAVAAMTTIVRERSAWVAASNQEEIFDSGVDSVGSLGAADRIAVLRFQAEVQKTALLARLVDLPLKMSAAGCMAGLRVDAGLRPQLTGMFFVPVEREAQATSVDDLGFN